MKRYSSSNEKITSALNKKNQIDILQEERNINNYIKKFNRSFSQKRNLLIRSPVKYH